MHEDVFGLVPCVSARTVCGYTLVQVLFWHHSRLGQERMMRLGERRDGSRERHGTQMSPDCQCFVFVFHAFKFVMTTESTMSVMKESEVNRGNSLILREGCIPWEIGVADAKG